MLTDKAKIVTIAFYLRVRLVNQNGITIKTKKQLRLIISPTLLLVVSIPRFCNNLKAPKDVITATEANIKSKLPKALPEKPNSTIYHILSMQQSGLYHKS